MPKDNIIDRLASFTEFNPRPVVEISKTGAVLYVNKSAKAVFPGLLKQGKKHPYLADFKTVLQHLKRNPKEAFSREVNVHGRWFRQFFYDAPAFQSILAYGLDITDRKAAEDELKKSDLQYRSLFNKISEGYALKEAIFDKKGVMKDYRFLDANPAYEQLVGRHRIKIIGKTARKIFTKDHEQLINIYKRVVATGFPERFERFHEHSNRYYEVFAYKTAKDQFAVLYLDITHLKKIEREKDNFISIMSHELRNPLLPITANVQFIQSLMKEMPVDNPEFRESIDIIARQAKNMAELLDDILDISRLSHQKIVLNLRRADVTQLIKHAIESTLPLMNSRKQKLSVMFEKEPMIANVDLLRFEQIIVNLVNNASKYTKPRGYIQISCTFDNRNIAIAVRDNGIGMDAKKIGKIFDLFSRATRPVMGIGGLGIGLNLVKSLVIMHKGTIQAKSAGKNKGSEFIVTIPAAKQVKVIKEHGKRKKNTKPASASSAPAKQKTVLVVDDNDDIKNTLARIIMHQGHNVVTASNGGMAVKMAKKHKPDVAIVDIGLPVMNGYKVAEILKKMPLPGGKKIKLIALTGYGQEKDKLLAKKAGFHQHLTKPVDLNYLLSLIGKSKQ